MSKKVNIVVLGSENFDDKAFVIGFLDQLNSFYKNNSKNVLSINSIYSGEFSGTSTSSKLWCELNNVEYVNHDFLSDIKDNVLFEQTDIPQEVMSLDPFFQKGKDFFMETGITMVIAFPDNNGLIGNITKNAIRMADMAGIQTLVNNDLYASILATREKDMANKAIVQKTPKKGVTKLGALDQI